MEGQGNPVTVGKSMLSAQSFGGRVVGNGLRDAWPLIRQNSGGAAPAGAAVEGARACFQGGLKIMDDTLSVALYARVSSQRQADELTIRSQVAGFAADEGRRFAVDEGLVSWTTDTVGHLVTAGVGAVARRGVCGGIDRLYIHSPDRLARKYAYQVLLVEELDKHGVEVIFLNDDLQHHTPEGNLLLQMQGVIAEYERAKILERTRRGRRYARTAR